ncbi:CCR4-NOT transcription complex subunit 7 isoform X2 [Apteryx mantelli]|uniref:poly(A)-specific ribonuclease n=1 Tax=Apteryx mantelli TaxID=2696672 RepID=A0ABM4EN49_9AVES|nr:PREDICTED: CCR4-NOT transcription complex subunit 7 isoform X2 [Apteryx mantelli mantelli]
MPAATVDHSQRICEVWACNLDEEMKKIRQVIRKYNYVAMDTEFPGVVARPIGEFRSNADYQYQLLRCNVDLLKIIQLGLTFMNEQGEYPPGTSTWQFNFKFNLTEDMYAQDSIELLTTSGIQFKKHEEEGIETQYFAELLMTSGVVLCEGVKWLSFHSGYDFGYLIKILTNSNLPEEELDFFEILRLFFPVIYDVKYLMKSCKNLKTGNDRRGRDVDCPTPPNTSDEMMVDLFCTENSCLATCFKHFSVVTLKMHALSPNICHFKSLLNCSELNCCAVVLY